MSTTDLDGIILHVLYARPRLNLQKVSYGVSVVKLSLNLQYRGKQEIRLKNKQIYINYQTYIYIFLLLTILQMK
jgi:hypothetical protein